MAMQMPQEAFFLLLQFYTEIPLLTRYMHLTRAGLACAGYDYLALSTSAASAQRAAVLQCAVRMLFVASRRELMFNESSYERLYRRQDRALQRIPSLVANDHVVYRVRQLVRAHEVISAAMAGLMQQFPQIRGAAARLLSRGWAQHQEDESSSESDASDDM